ncbi:VapB protein (antitoxin to VapC) [plant metagenome]|uniref:VapB protein (Antitoxin to VapC) n=3 Tax=root TaxID=1 RepID=A0A1C3JYC6_9BURK|nr:VapB protein (antitoxin to VapC) [Orrella dioscoreae]SOE51419.1 VapB protein (antitoxin to VapC) [Orrella dioscoreae]
MPEGVTRVDILSIGRTRILAPAGEAWDSWFQAEGASADFMDTRDQPADQHRETW